MSLRSRRVALAALVALAGSCLAAAQDESASPRRRGEGRREEAFKMVDAYLVSNLQQSLALTDEQYAKVLPLVTRLQSDRRAYLVERGRLLREMRRLMGSGAASEGEVLARLKELKQVETDGPARVRTDMEALDAGLSPLQQAKYRVLELDVEQRLRELMGRARTNRRGAGAPPP